MPQVASQPAIHDPAAFAAQLLAWYDSDARVLPWRIPPGSSRAADPYHVWLSEIMLQQTTVAAVIPYFRGFTERWPNVAALAAAPVEDVLAAWAGLGYYARARNLHACAQQVSRQHGGRFPDTLEGLRALPGIGDYTAAAIAAIAFGRPATVVDGNIERVMARIGVIDVPLPAGKAPIRDLAARLTPQRRPGDYAQALMDLGARICTPRKPQCLLCPVRTMCRAHREGKPEAFPVKLPKQARPVRRGVAFWLESGGAVCLLRRPAKGLLGGLLALPSTPWQAALPDDWQAMAPAEATPQLLAGAVRHVFTHFELHLQLAAAELPARPAIAGAHWWRIEDLERAGLPTVMAKAVRHVLASRSAG